MPQGHEAEREATIEYHGETKSRRPRIAALCALIAPGLAYLYVGRLARGLTVNLVFVLVMELFLILWMSQRFFPVGPALVFMLAGLIGALVVARHVVGIIKRDKLEQEYVIRPINHWLVYGLVALGTFYLPAVLSVKFLVGRMVSVVKVEGTGMMPTLRDGDVILVDRVVSPDSLRVGALMSFFINKDNVRTMRLVAKPGDTVRIESGFVVRNDVFLKQEELKPEEVLQGAEIFKEWGDKVLWMKEKNGGQMYPIAVARRVVDKSEASNKRVGAGSFYLLLDNRKQAMLIPGERKMRDSRNFGPVPADRILGMPSYVLWSQGAGGEVEWDRIGIKVQ